MYTGTRGGRGDGRLHAIAIAIARIGGVSATRARRDAEVLKTGEQWWRDGGDMHMQADMQAARTHVGWHVPFRLARPTCSQGETDDMETWSM